MTARAKLLVDIELTSTHVIKKDTIGTVYDVGNGLSDFDYVFISTANLNDAVYVIHDEVELLEDESA